MVEIPTARELTELSLPRDESFAFASPSLERRVHVASLLAYQASKLGRIALFAEPDHSLGDISRRIRRRYHIGGGVLSGSYARLASSLLGARRFPSSRVVVLHDLPALLSSARPSLVGLVDGVVARARKRGTTLVVTSERPYADLLGWLGAPRVAVEGGVEEARLPLRRPHDHVRYAVLAVLHRAHLPWSKLSETMGRTLWRALGGGPELREVVRSMEGDGLVKRIGGKYGASERGMAAVRRLFERVTGKRFVLRGPREPVGVSPRIIERRIRWDIRTLGYTRATRVADWAVLEEGLAERREDVIQLVYRALGRMVDRGELKRAVYRRASGKPVYVYYVDAEGLPFDPGHTCGQCGHYIRDRSICVLWKPILGRCGIFPESWPEGMEDISFVEDDKLVHSGWDRRKGVPRRINPRSHACRYFVRRRRDTRKKEIAHRVTEGRKVYLCEVCVPPNTLVHSGGMKPIQGVTVEDRTIYGGKVLRIFEKWYKGELIEVKGVGMLPFRVTPEHPILVSEMKAYRGGGKRSFSPPRFKRAKGISPWNWKEGTGDALVIPRLRSEVTRRELSFSHYTTLRGLDVVRNKGYPTEFRLDAGLAWLLGLYVADGSASQTRILLYLSREKTIEKACNIIRELGYSPYIQDVKGEDCVKVNIMSKLMARAFSDWCGHNAHKKMVPSFIMECPNNIVKSFIKGYLDGDGCHDRSQKCWTARTVSKALALQLQLLTASLGKPARICRRGRKEGKIGGRVIKGGRSYSLLYLDREPYRPQVKVTDDYVFLPVKSIRRLPYYGPVYNLETERNVYLVSNVVVHNCGSEIGTPSTTPTYCRTCGTGYRVAADGRVDIHPSYDHLLRKAYAELTGEEPLVRRPRPPERVTLVLWSDDHVTVSDGWVVVEREGVERSYPISSVRLVVDYGSLDDALAGKLRASAISVVWRAPRRPPPPDPDLLRRVDDAYRRGSEIARGLVVSTVLSMMAATKRMGERWKPWKVSLGKTLLYQLEQYVKMMRAPLDRLLTYEGLVGMGYWRVYKDILRRKGMDFPSRRRGRFVREFTYSSRGRARGYTPINAAINFLHQRRLLRCRTVNARKGLGWYGDEGLLHRAAGRRRIGLLLDLSDPFKLADREALIAAVLEGEIGPKDFAWQLGRRGTWFCYPRRGGVEKLEKVGSEADEMPVHYKGRDRGLVEAYEEYVGSFTEALTEDDPGKLVPFVLGDRREHEWIVRTAAL